MKKRSIFTISVFALLMLAGIYYARLGGFNEMQKEVVKQPKLYFTGVSYHGLSSDDSLMSLMDKEFNKVRNSELSGDFSVCFLGNPDSEKDSLTIWVGATSLTSPESALAGYTTWELPEAQVLRATINAYSVVAPNPDKVNEQLREMAVEQGLSTDSIYLERYPSPEQIFNEIYVKP